jgi:hypothetical protein
MSRRLQSGGGKDLLDIRKVDLRDFQHTYLIMMFLLYLVTVQGSCYGALSV